ncbi:beta-D-glucosyl crocetin beta-1,6-glucosyltransferase-like [Actinidia eriantha]|uniref:beta-D-glucosyl crocetin beta-1,6-glucosyltransferase-like n=1 Tax=Actinidia eriantha TaxID=165200 RepID=UPI00258F3F6F|nr:beta-D-glucosyl crocetin beta-1,6-glucosyltransferase-like [Actinidia eriantha]
MFPWLAHGHISPFLELAKTLSKRNFNIYLCSTPINLASIKKKLTEEFSNSIHLLELQVPTMPGLPPKYHTTKNLPPHLMPTLKKAFDRSMQNFAKTLKTLKPDLLIYDTIQPWAPAIASRHDVPAVAFISTSATMTSFMFHHHKNRGTDFPFRNIYLHDHEENKFAHLLQSSENYYEGKKRFFESLNKSSGIILIKSSREIEGKYIDHLSVLTGKKIVPVGPLVQDPMNENEHLSIVEWLDKKGLGSTVFVSFGSEYFLSKEEMQEMAHGLELSGVNFIWVVRFPDGKKTRVWEETMPKGFLEKVGERGLIIQGWAPQVKILEHPSVGGFVSHCGWSSMMEGIKYGVPIIAVPMHLDQPVNARLLSEIGVGVEVKRDENGRLVREEVAKVVKEVVGDKSR